MGLIVVAADKGAPGVTTTALALAAVWPRAVLLAECDPAGGDLAYRFPAASGERLDPRRGMLSLAVAARHGLQPGQVWEHTQKLHGGMDVLLGVTNAEQGAGLSMFWGQLGRVLAAVPQADVIADCGRLGADGPVTDLLAGASQVLLLTRAEVGEVIRLRDRTVALATAVEKRGRRGFIADVVVVADQKNFKAELAEVAHVLSQGRAPARVAGGIVSDSRAAGLLRGHWGGKLDKSLLIRSVREIAGQLVAAMPPQASPAGPRAAHERPDARQAPAYAAAQQAPGQPAPWQHAGADQAPSQYTSGSYTDPGQADGRYASGQHVPGQDAGAERAPGHYASGQTAGADQASGLYRYSRRDASALGRPGGVEDAGGQYAAGQQAPGQYAGGEQGSGQYGSGQYAAGQQALDQRAGADQVGGQYVAGRLGIEHVDGRHASGQDAGGPYAADPYGSGQHVNGQHASAQQAPAQPSFSPAQPGPDTRAPRHRYEPDGRPDPPGEAPPDGAAHDQVPQYRGR